MYKSHMCTYVAATEQIYNIWFFCRTHITNLQYRISEIEVSTFFLHISSIKIYFSRFWGTFILNTPSCLKVIFVLLSQLQNKSTVYDSFIAPTKQIYSIAFPKPEFQLFFSFFIEKNICFQDFEEKLLWAFLHV